MNDLARDRMRRFFKRFGIRLMKAPYYKFEYDKENFPGLEKHPAPVVFDIGANIGQSAIWFSKSFPTAQIHAFEPIPTVFRRLEREVNGMSNIVTVNLACGDANKIVHIPPTSSETIQTIRVLAVDTGLAEGDKITVTTVDDYCEANGISSIQILKTDTEGYDLDVFQGASRMLSSKNINYILSEVSIAEGDKQHTNLFEATEWLKPFGFEPVSFYDLLHDRDTGRLIYFNALFARRV